MWIAERRSLGKNHARKPATPPLELAQGASSPCPTHLPTHPLQVCYAHLLAAASTHPGTLDAESFVAECGAAVPPLMALVVASPVAFIVALELLLKEMVAGSRQVRHGTPCCAALCHAPPASPNRAPPTAAPCPRPFLVAGGGGRGMRGIRYGEPGGRAETGIRLPRGHEPSLWSPAWWVGWPLRWPGCQPLARQYCTSAGAWVDACIGRREGAPWHSWPGHLGG